jgi:hypothetical protein
MSCLNLRNRVTAKERGNTATEQRTGQRTSEQANRKNGPYPECQAERYPDGIWKYEKSDASTEVTANADCDKAGRRQSNQTSETARDTDEGRATCRCSHEQHYASTYDVTCCRAKTKTESN